MLRAPVAPRVLTVSELVLQVRDALEREVGGVWVAGELSNVKRAASGHLYFSLKDNEAQIAAVMFRSAAQTMVFAPTDGTEVLVRGRVSLYPARGALQLYVDAMEPQGLGALQLAFEQLKAKLEAEGLFAPERKRSLPTWPNAVGIVTALTGAVVHDLRTVLRRRWPLARVIVRPVRVQGTGAAQEIAQGIADLNQLGGIDVLIVGRGGGSLEDLWAFNEEIVARAIATSAVPVVSAVGHEVDFTIADFVADARAPTPTAAAALVVPDRAEVARALARHDDALRRTLARRMALARERVVALRRGLGDPARRVRDLAQRLDELGVRARRALVRRVAWDRRELTTYAARLTQVGPGPRVQRLRQRVGALVQRAEFAMPVRLERARRTLAELTAKLEVLSPLASLARGYAIARRGDEHGPVVADAAQLAVGDRLALVFAHGKARARVEATED